MKHLLPALILIALFSGWSDVDKSLYGAYLIIYAADWNQTLEIADNPEDYYENNPIIGEHPSRVAVNNWMALGLVGNYLVADVVGPKWRRPLIWTMIIAQGLVVNRNLQVGLRW